MAEITLEYNESDLARLVLDYLEEEECPAAYNAFIKSSRHLDTRTSYQTSSFKSLRDIYAEYCTFRTYTRSGKVPALHSQMLRCKNILNTAQLLFAYVKMLQSMLDHTQDSAPPSSTRRGCEVCGSIDNTDECVCRARPLIQPYLFVKSFKPYDASPVKSLVETTQLADLPGTSAVVKRKDAQHLQRARVNETDPRLCRSDVPETAVESQTTEIPVKEIEARKEPPSISAQSLSLSVKTTDLTDCSEDLNDILSMVNRTGGVTTNTSHISGPNRSSNTVLDPVRRNSSMERSFHDFVSGVGSAAESKTVQLEAMPDSSTPESINTQNALPCSNYNQGLMKITPMPIKIVNENPTLKLINLNSHLNVNPAGNPKTSEIFPENVNTIYVGCRPANQTDSSSSPNKVKILSNNKLSGDESKMFISKATKPTSVLKALPCKPAGISTFTTLSSKVIQINGLAAYSQSTAPTAGFTKDQIMAMPTVFVLQPPSTSHTSSTSSTCVTTSISTNPTITAPIPVDSGYKSLEPISVDVPPPEQLTALQNVQFNLNGVMPKETASMENVSTPNKPLLVKKASSTPRRTSSSHIRVLDFNTPRRIMVEEACQEEATDGEPISSAPEGHIIPVHSLVSPTDKIEMEKVQQVDFTKPVKAGWDADLRALLPTPELEKEKLPKKKKTPKSSKNKETPSTIKKSQKESKSKTKKTEKTSKRKVTVPSEEAVGLPPKPVTVKPNINIKKSREDLKGAPTKEEKCIEISIPDNKTPETDKRPTADKPPSAKNSLSDFFSGIQTPLKVMLENIQMETPRFDPSVLGDPISDIKIGDIPTPNFFNTPNYGLSGGKGLLGPGATPSSYSSRPTDYSSGGSYYRPEEQDYVPPFDEYQPPPLPSPTPIESCTKPQAGIKPQTNVKTPRNKQPSESESCGSKSSRPRRQCTLKVSYYETTTLKTNKASENKSLTDSPLGSGSNTAFAASPSSSDCYLKVQCNDLSEKEKIDQEQFKDFTKTLPNLKDIKESQDVMTLELESKRKRLIAALKKKTPVKSSKKRRSGSSFPKLKIRDTKSLSKRPKTVAELKRSVAPRRMPNESMERSKQKTMVKNQLECCVSIAATPAPTRSRRKSSTPRKVDKFAAHNIDDSASADTLPQKQVAEVTEDELPPLRMSSDDGSQDSRSRKITKYKEVENDEIHQIRAFIEKSSQTSEPTIKELVQRGFDLVTAKSIERDLLGTPCRDINECEEEVNIVDLSEEESSKLIVNIEEPSVISTSTKEDKPTPKKDQQKETADVSTRDTANASMSKDESTSKNDSAVLLVNDFCMSNESFNEESGNYFTYQFDEETVQKNREKITIDEDFNFSVQFNVGYNIDSINVCLVKQETLFDIPPSLCNNVSPENADESLESSSSSSSSDTDDESEIETNETLSAVQSISNINPLYTPMKISYDTMQRQCIDIFDSTLNSLDTPLKPDTPFKLTGANTPRGDPEPEGSCSKLAESVKRKRDSDSPVEESLNKKSRPDRRLLQHIDIDLVLTKIHGESDKS